MKRIISLILCIAFMLSLAGCGNEPENVFDALIGASSSSSVSESEIVSQTPTESETEEASESVSETKSEPESETESETVSETESEATSESEAPDKGILPEITVPEISAEGKILVYRKSDDSYVRTLAATAADLNELGSDEYYSFSMELTYNGKDKFKWTEAYVIVDSGEKWGWGAGEALNHSVINFRIFYVNMQKCMTPGAHTAEWFIDGEKMLTETFFIDESYNWAEKFEMPDSASISNHNASSTCRSPYIAGWFSIPEDTRYTEYSVDFKVDHLPIGTYCCLGNWVMDYSYLESQYASVHTEYVGVSAYAGFQNIYDGSKKAIMSFWDVYCEDYNGNNTTIRAKQIYPEDAQMDSFGGEGTGARALVDYQWESGHWYTMHIRCRVSDTTGNTVVEQWVCDLETGEWTLLTAYDIGFKNSAFKGSIAIFLENYLNEYSGEVRTMTVRNPRYLDVKTNQWRAINEVYLSSNGGLPTYDGSYNFGVEDDTVWMITSGVGGDWFNNGKGKKADWYNLK
ncbi:MAG: DUF3472 domain-containing protein [Ruminococcaceae bacterium]|nr:DUF3472 domain-containing protein [Oscillospiraceae bacterium]